VTLALTAVLSLSALGLAGPARAASPRVPADQRLALLTHDHTARSGPSAHAGRIESVDSRRPLTGTRTVLPVVGDAVNRSGGIWLRVRLPGRPNSHTGWISAEGTKLSSTNWRLVVSRAARQLVVYRSGQVVRRFRAVVGKPSTPTPRGSFFVEESIALSRTAAGAPFALATSARSRSLHEFDGGPGQIAIHGTDHLSGAPGTAVSHGCVRLDRRHITWLARRIGAGVPLTIRR
jgi:lipoprotein-anchoring transpeptidase ErfK/SrfK